MSRAEYRYEQPFASSLFVSIPRRLGEQGFEELTEHFMTQVHKIEQNIKLKQKGKNTRSDAPTPPGSCG